MNPGVEKKKEMFYAMLRIRRIQERIESCYLQDEMKTPVHLYIGQEAIAVGVCSALKKDDYISSNHRSHGHYLAKGGDLRALIAELHCKKEGCSKGYGGSMHLVDTSIGHLGSSSIVGGGIPIGTGLALASKMNGGQRVSAVFFGDGAADEGVLYESINFAMLKTLPAVYILENNHWSVCSHVSARKAGDNIFHQALPDLLMSRKIDGNNILAVYQAALEAIERARRGSGPSFLECETYRILGHAGCESQDPEGYRDCAEVKAWKKKCPVDNFREQLLKEKTMTPAEITAMEIKIEIEIDDAFAFARKSPLPAGRELENHLFCE
ncbi:putative TPP-dependent acetoin dehydrogenase complex, E1 component, alpha subunit [delta proteobacterium NaphS2]|nr:putative TPP-dependent acetoin dehydrogenase complex, E1 component, alpha subunit [delta proteobacterium NaphS2]